MSNLYEIDKEINKLLNGEFEDQEEAQGKFIELELQKEEKIENTIAWIRDIEGDFDTINKEIKRLQDLKQDKQNRIDRAKSLLQYILKNEKYETPLFKISFRRSEKVLVSSSFNDDEYMTIKETKTPDKKKIKEAIKEGKLISGVGLEENYSIQIK